MIIAKFCVRVESLHLLKNIFTFFNTFATVPVIL